MVLQVRRARSGERGFQGRLLKRYVQSQDKGQDTGHRTGQDTGQDKTGDGKAAGIPLTFCGSSDEISKDPCQVPTVRGRRIMRDKDKTGLASDFPVRA